MPNKWVCHERGTGPRLQGTVAQALSLCPTAEERQWNHCLEARGMLDAALQVPNKLLFFPIHSANMYRANYNEEAAEHGYTYYHPAVSATWTTSTWTEEPGG